MKVRTVVSICMIFTLILLGAKPAHATTETQTYTVTATEIGCNTASAACESAAQNLAEAKAQMAWDAANCFAYTSMNVTGTSYEILDIEDDFTYVESFTVTISIVIPNKKPVCD